MKNISRTLILVVMGMLALIGISGVVEADSGCATTFTPSCGYVLPHGTFFYTASNLTLTSGQIIPAGNFYNPLTGEFFSVGSPGAGGATSTIVGFGLGAGSGSASGAGYPIGSFGNNGTSTASTTRTTGTSTSEVNYVNYNYYQNYQYYQQATSTTYNYDQLTVTSATSTPYATSSTPYAASSTPSLIGAPDAGGMGGGEGSPGAPNAGAGGELAVTLFNLLSSSVMAAGAATYIIRNSINYK